MRKTVTSAGLSVLTLAFFGVFLALDAKNKRSETMEQFITSGIVLLIAIGLLIYTGYYVYKNFFSKCANPSDTDKEAAGGNKVLTFKLDSDTGNCIAKTCVDGYTVDAGICVPSKQWQSCGSDSECTDSNTFCLKSDINNTGGRCLTYGDCQWAAWNDCTTMEAKCATDDWKATKHPTCRNGSDWNNPYQ